MMGGLARRTFEISDTRTGGAVAGKSPLGFIPTVRECCFISLFRAVNVQLVVDWQSRVEESRWRRQIIFSYLVFIWYLVFLIWYLVDKMSRVASNVDHHLGMLFKFCVIYMVN